MAMIQTATTITTTATATIHHTGIHMVMIKTIATMIMWQKSRQWMTITTHITATTIATVPMRNIWKRLKKTTTVIMATQLIAPTPTIEITNIDYLYLQVIPIVKTILMSYVSGVAELT